MTHVFPQRVGGLEARVGHFVSGLSWDAYTAQGREAGGGRAGVEVKGEVRDGGSSSSRPRMKGLL